MHGVACPCLLGCKAPSRVCANRRLHLQFLLTQLSSGLVKLQSIQVNYLCFLTLVMFPECPSPA